MAKLSKIEYEALKALNPEDLTNQDRRDIIDFERAEAQAPSLDDVEWAIEIHDMASKNPSTVGAELKAIGDYDKALKILEQEHAYNNIKGGRAKDAYVQPVKRIPDDLIKENGFNFNWKSAYENTKGEKLRDTEADYDKLQKFIESNMYKEGDPNVNLQKIAYDMHMYNPNTMKWTDFINSEQGEEFKKYIKDVEKNQRTARIKDIFDNESNFLVDFGLPVAKAHAQQQLLEGKDPKMGLPLAADFAANALMFGGNKAALVGAPAITNIGEGFASNEELPVSLSKAALGIGTNLVAPRRIERAGRWFVQPGEGYSERKAMQATIDNTARKVGDIEKKLNNGAALPIKRSSTLSGDDAIKATIDGTADDIVAYKNVKDKIIYTDRPQDFSNYLKAGYKFKSMKQAPHNTNGLVTAEDFQWALNNESVLRHLKPSEIKATKSLRDRSYKLYNNDKPKLKDTQKIIDDAFDKWAKTGHLDKMSMNQLYALGFKPRKSFINFVARVSPETLKNYGTNFMGRKISGGAAVQLPQMLLGVDFNTLIKQHKKDKPTISEIFGNDALPQQSDAE